jgi:hypothetical protein
MKVARSKDRLLAEKSTVSAADQELGRFNVLHYENGNVTCSNLKRKEAQMQAHLLSLC